MLARVTEPGKAAFSLRKGELGVSVFDLEKPEPPLTETEILDAFRPGSLAIIRSSAEIEAKGLVIVPVPGVESLGERLRVAHCEIRPGATMDRTEFKRVLRELE